VSIALEQLAVETLMVSDVLFRSRNIEQRKKYVKLVEKAKDQNVVSNFALVIIDQNFITLATFRM
jgi:stalled ribosome rescue protein Dom34